VKTLTTATRADNARFFAAPDEVPRHVVTQGLGTISDARHLVLIATGEKKAAPIARAVEGPLTAACPASVIQLHPHATVVVDEAAAAELTLAEYYREAYAGKPSWQGL
jgi:glucosamine-6-phosphate deaminase